MRRGKAIGVLNRLNAEGAIIGFKSGLFESDGNLANAQVIVMAPPRLSHAEVPGRAFSVMEELEPFVGEVTVTAMRDPATDSEA